MEKGMKFISYITAMLLFFSFGSGEIFLIIIVLVVVFGPKSTFRHNAHVRVDLFYDRFSPKTQGVINMLSIIIFILPFSFLIIYIGVEFAYMSYAQNEASSNPGGLTHRWIVKSLMPLAFILLALEATIKLFEEFKKWRTL